MDTSLQLTCVPVEYLSHVWDDAKALLERTLATSTAKYSLDDVYTAVHNGEMLLWLVIDGSTPVAAITTRVIVYPRRRALALDWIGGSRMSEWLPMLHTRMIAHAKLNDCQHLEGYGRRAWGRLLEKHGWKPEYIAYKMELTDAG